MSNFDQMTVFIFSKLSWTFTTLHKKLSFPLRISSVNVIKSAVSYGFGHIYWRNPYWNTSFFVQCQGHIQLVIDWHQFSIPVMTTVLKLHTFSRNLQTFQWFRNIFLKWHETLCLHLTRTMTEQYQYIVSVNSQGLLLSRYRMSTIQHNLANLHLTKVDFNYSQFLIHHLHFQNQVLGGRDPKIFPLQHFFPFQLPQK